MDVGTITGAISNVGFPIAMCIYLIYTHRQEITLLSKAIDNNTKAIEKIERSIDKWQKKE